MKSSQLPPQSAKPTTVQQEEPAVSPTLVPALPVPLPPTATNATASADELAFFDRVKKFVGNKNTMNEFLKLCNLYSQDLIDKNSLVFRVSNFLGTNPDLLNWFKAFVDYDGKDQIIENRAKPASGRVVLNNCRAYGPSYRLLPKRERSRKCSGRDDLCQSVLNDEWASHPTWASEDSGFIAHRKNQFEETLHRIEEERHDYDHFIAVVERSVQLLSPMAQQKQMMSEAEIARWKLPRDFGGQSQSIIKRALAKIYHREAALQVMSEMLDRPAVVIPVLLLRFKHKLEEWKASHVSLDLTPREDMLTFRSVNGKRSGAMQLKSSSGEVSITKASTLKWRTKGSFRPRPFKMRSTSSMKNNEGNGYYSTTLYQPFRRCIRSPMLMSSSTPLGCCSHTPSTPTLRTFQN